MDDGTLSRLDGEEFPVREVDNETERPFADALAELVHQIAIGQYRDPHGHAAVRNTAFLNAKALVDLQNVLEQRA